MAITATSVYSPRVPGSEKISCTDITIGNPYATNGVAVTFADLGFTGNSQITFAIAKIKVPGATATAVAQYDVTNQKIIVYNTTAEVANGTDLSACVVRVLAFGRE